MASKAQITSEIMAEFGRTEPNLHRRVEMVVGEVTVELLSQNDARFSGLEKTKTISILVDQKQYKLPSDFATAQSTFFQVDTDGDFVRELQLVSEREYYRRLSDSGYGGVGVYYAYIDYVYDHSEGPGFYLTLGADPASTGTYKFPYYRAPNENDTPLIRNTAIVKRGVKSRFPELNPAAGTDAAVYQNMKESFQESPTKKAPDLSLKPNRVTVSHNRLMHRIGGGE